MMLDNYYSPCFRKPEGIFNLLLHREVLPVNSLLKFTIHLPLVDQANSPCPETVVGLKY